ncbi:MAG: hypothetical protein AAFN50_09715 [Pseudomonadota bacterium]
MTRFIAINDRKYDTWRMRIVLAFLSVAALAATPGTAAAFDLEETLREQHVQYVAADELRVAQSGGKSLDQAIAEIRRRTGGKVVSAETRVQGGREVHLIKVLTKDGRVKTHRVNGKRR